MTTADCGRLSGQQIEAIAWGFLRSEFTHQKYAIWPIDGRIDAYLLRRGLQAVINDGSTFDLLRDRVMANMGRALRAGILRPGEDAP